MNIQIIIYTDYIIYWILHTTYFALKTVGKSGSVNQTNVQQSERWVCLCKTFKISPSADTSWSHLIYKTKTLARTAYTFSFSG